MSRSIYPVIANTRQCINDLCSIGDGLYMGFKRGIGRIDKIQCRDIACDTGSTSDKEVGTDRDHVGKVAYRNFCIARTVADLVDFCGCQQHPYINRISYFWSFSKGQDVVGHSIGCCRNLLYTVDADNGSCCSTVASQGKHQRAAITCKLLISDQSVFCCTNLYPLIVVIHLQRVK